MASPQNTAGLGTSLALVEGDFRITGGQLAMVEGLANFAQAMQVIIGTPFGSDVINVNYGLDVASIYTVASTVGGTKDLIRLNIVKSLAGDNRIAQIDGVVFDDDPDYDLLAMRVGGPDAGATARRTRVWHAAVSLTLASGPQQIVISGVKP